MEIRHGHAGEVAHAQEEREPFGVGARAAREGAQGVEAVQVSGAAGVGDGGGEGVGLGLWGGTTGGAGAAG